MDRPSVLLVQPPIYDFALFDLFFKPYGLLRLGSGFKQAGYAVHLLNSLDWRDARTEDLLGKVKRNTRGTGKFFRQPARLPEGVEPIRRQYSRYGIAAESMRERILSAAPDIVCITTGMTYWYQGVVEAAEMVRKYAPGAKIILGGIYATLMPEHAKRVTGADAVLPGDADQQLARLLGQWGFPEIGDSVPELPLLSEEVWAGSAGVVRLNQGCPMSCDYCASSLICPGFIPGDPDAAFSFILELHRRFGTRDIGFYDDALLVNREEVLLPFLEHACSSGIDWRFYTPNAMHIRMMDFETACMLKRSGFQEVRLGFESSSTDFHAEHDRKFVQDEFSRAVDVLTKAGFRKDQLPVYVLAGLPGQRKEEVAGSISSAADTGVSVSLAEFSPVPGTPAWEETLSSCRYPLASEPLYHNNSFQPTNWEGLTREDMEKLKQLARQTRV